MTSKKVYTMSFSNVYACLIAKAERKNRTKAEVDEIICWLTGYSSESLAQLSQGTICYGDFFRSAPAMNPDRKQITGSVCGVRVETIRDP